jgi:formamidopyrimidine-DNA glycosylase
MPELPEVEYAASIARQAVVGRTIALVDVRHRSQRRRLTPGARRLLVGDRVEQVDRRGKYQLLRLASGRSLLVHFRMTGDWVVLARDAAVPRAVRVLLTFTDGTRLGLLDTRALSAVELIDAGVDPLAGLGPDATDRAFSVAWLRRVLARRRDQAVAAGIGNIYASEALWRARIDPRAPASSLGPATLARLVTAVRQTLRLAMRDTPRYCDEGFSGRFQVYDREGERCRRCGGTVRRLVQAGRSTYWCPACQASGRRRRAQHKA